MSTSEIRVGFGRRFVSLIVDLAIAAGIGFMIMWPLGTFEGEEAFYQTQAIMRILGLLVGGFVLSSGWLWVKHRRTAGKWVMSIGNGSTIAHKAVAWWKLLFRVLLVFVLAAAPLILLITSLFMGW